MHKKLEKELQTLRKDIAEVIENSTQAYDHREEAQAKMVLMRDKEDKDKVQLNSEIKELIRVIDHDKKLKEFMKIKTQERQEDEELVSWRKKKGLYCISRKKINKIMTLFLIQRRKHKKNVVKKKKNILSRLTKLNLKKLNKLLAKVTWTNLSRDSFKLKIKTMHCSTT